MRALVAISVAAMFVAGCASQYSYRPPMARASANNSIIVEKPRSQVWASTIPALGQRFFTINNMDKESGFINLSYSGDPESYVDCGTISSYVKNLRGERNYTFPGSRAAQQYELMNSAGLFRVNRSMSLEGRVNLTFEEVSPTQTRVTANTRYVVTRNLTVSDMEGRSHSMANTVSFNTGGQGTLPAEGSQTQTPYCAANGRLERDILATVH